MADELYLRAGDSDRESVTSFLSGSLQHGYIDPTELSERLDKLNASKTYADLLPLVQDIPGGRQVIKDIVARHRRSASTHPALAGRPASPPRRPRHVGRNILLGLMAWLIAKSVFGIAAFGFKFMMFPILGFFMQALAVGFLVWLVVAVLRPRHRRF